MLPKAVPNSHFVVVVDVVAFVVTFSIWIFVIFLSVTIFTFSCHGKFYESFFLSLFLIRLQIKAISKAKRDIFSIAIFRTFIIHLNAIYLARNRTQTLYDYTKENMQNM